MSLKKLNKHGMKKYKKYGYVAAIFLILDVIVGFMIPYISEEILNNHVPSQDTDMILKLSLVMFGLSALGIVFLLVNSFYGQKAAQFAAADLREASYTKIQSLSFKNIDKYKSGRLITTVTNDITQVRNYYGMKYTLMYRAPFYIIFGVVFAIISSIKLSVVLTFMVPALIISTLIVVMLAAPYFKKLQESTDKINVVAIDNVNSPRVFKSFVTEDEEYSKFGEVNNNYKDNAFNAEKRMHIFFPLTLIILNASTALLFVLGAIFIDQGLVESNVGTFLAFISYLNKVLGGVMIISMMFLFITRAIVSAKRINQILEEEIDITNNDSSLPYETNEGRITFNNVDFTYKESSNNVISNINLEIKPGEKIGIIGSTGSGKSSLIKLIPRLYDVTNGEVLIDGTNVKDYNLQSLRSNISLASQEAVVFKGTIRSNIMQGKSDATEEEILHAAVMSCADEFINSKEQGLDSIIEERGNNLSGGQKQRLSLARALVRNPKILILDDVTSALDAKSEAKVRNNLKTYKDMTTLVVSQKISSIIDMDRIIVFDNYGKIDGYDTHSNLLKTSTVYKELHISQFGGEDNE